MKIETTCPRCGKKTLIEVESEAYNAWRNGACIQNAFPDLSPAEREMLITGICDNCWKEIFCDYEEE